MWVIYAIIKTENSDRDEDRNWNWNRFQWDRMREICNKE